MKIPAIAAKGQLLRQTADETLQNKRETARRFNTTAARLLTRKGLSDRWQLSIETLKRRERCGVLRVLKLGRGVRYRLSDIEHLEAEAEVSPSGASVRVTIGGAAV
jgi:hypothetical protein